MKLSHPVALLSALVLGVCLGATAGFAADGLNLEAILIWGTDGPKPPNKDLKDLEPELARKLGKAPYKWKNYFEVDRKTFSVPSNATNKVAMSKHCLLEIKNLQNDRVEVKLIGQGKPVTRQVESLPPGHTMVLSGDDNNDTAWLIVLRQVSAKK